MCNAGGAIANDIRAETKPAPSVAVMWLGAFVVAVLLYGLTADRGVEWQDSGWQQLRIVTGQIDHPNGLALTHPVQFWLGRAAITCLPFVEPAFAITLVSALAGAVAVANITATLRSLTGGVWPAIIAGGGFLVSHTFWMHGTHTESYAIVGALLTFEWLCMARYIATQQTRWLILLPLANGLGVANHMLAALAAPVNFAWIAALWWRRPGFWRWLAGSVGLWLIGTLPLLALIVQQVAATGDVAAALHSALFGSYERRVLNFAVNARSLLLTIGFIGYNFPNLVLPLAVWGLLRGPANRALRRVFLAELAIYTLFVVRYAITDQYTFYFPVYALLAVFGGCGLAALGGAARGGWRRVIAPLAAISIILTPAVHWATYATLKSRGMLSGMVGAKPFRDGYATFFLPWGVEEDHGPRLNRAAYEAAGRDGVILAGDNMTIFALEYAQQVGRGSKDVMIRNLFACRYEPGCVDKLRVEVMASLAEGRPVVLLPFHREHPESDLPGAAFRRVEDVYVVTAMTPPEVDATAVGDIVEESRQ